MVEMDGVELLRSDIFIGWILWYLECFFVRKGVFGLYSLGFFGVLFE